MTTFAHSRRIVICGNGIAAWAAACALAPLARELGGWLQVVECADIDWFATLRESGGGGLPSLRAWHRMLGIDEREFMRRAHACFRLGVRFEDAAGSQQPYFHPFSSCGSPLDGIAFQHHWLRAARQTAFEAFSLNAAAARCGKFVHPSSDPRSVLSTLDYGYQFDPLEYRDFLRSTAIERGATAVAARIVNVQGEIGGRIDTLELDSAERLNADLFVDCLHPEQSLLARHARADYQDWRAYLPFDRMVAARAPDRSLPPYSTMQAQVAGWKHTLHTQGVCFVMHCYSSAHVSEGEARAHLLEGMEQFSCSEPLHVSAQRREQPWIANTIAIGEAACLDPAGHSSLQNMQSGVSRLLDLFPFADRSDGARAEYNRLMADELDRTRDYLSVWYCMYSHAAPFWRSCADGPKSQALQHKLRLFRQRGRLVMFDEEAFDEAEWTPALIARGVVPENIDPLADTLPLAAVTEQLARMRAAIAQAAQGMPEHAKIIEQHCRASGATQRRS